MVPATSPWLADGPQATAKTMSSSLKLIFSNAKSGLLFQIVLIG